MSVWAAMIGGLAGTFVLTSVLRAASERVGQEPRTVMLRAGQRRVQVAGSDRRAVVRDPGDMQGVPTVVFCPVGRPCRHPRRARRSGEITQRYGGDTARARKAGHGT